jgi:septal ring factor EnvC (AmiA/AmiB activator)
MEILDIDMQMVRDALKDAPEFAKGHFENLLSQYETAAARVEELKEVESDLEHAQTLLKSAEEDVASLEEQLAQRDSDQDTALEAVKYWMQDALVLHKPITDPRKILRMVEDAIQ